MPKSKRERKSALTRVQKKTRASKDALLAKMRTAVEELPYAYVFSVANMKNSTMKDVREQWPGSKFFLGKNKVMQLALGKTKEEELKPGLAKFAQYITGARGVLMTEKSVEEVKQALGSFKELHYARSGFHCTENYRLAAGTLPIERCPHPMEPMLRKLGLPTKLVQGKVELLNDVNVCRRGDILTPEQCKILQIFGIKLAKFTIVPLVQYKDGKVIELELEAEEEIEEAKDDEEGIELRTAGGEFDGVFSYSEDGGDEEEMKDGEEDDDDAEME